MFLWMILILISVVTAEIWHNNEETNKSYYVSGETIDWTSAQAECIQRGSKLAVIVDGIDNEFVHDITPHGHLHWIGLRRGNSLCTCLNVNKDDCELCRETFIWANDSTLMTYIAPWGANHPLNTENRNCGVMAKHFAVWLSSGCTSNKRFVCQYNCELAKCQRRYCEFSGSAYQCTCYEGYTGSHCDIDIDECQTVLCPNNAQCVDGVNSYECVCIEGYTGQHCETDIEDCIEENQCGNFGTCKDGINRFECVCISGYTGTTCENNIDDCAIKPCLNNGTCTDLVNGFECNCTGDFYGNSCENSETNNQRSQDGKGLQNAFYVGVALFSVAFVCMIITIVIYIKTAPKSALQSKTPESTYAENVMDEVGKAGACSSEASK